MAGDLRLLHEEVPTPERLQHPLLFLFLQRGLAPAEPP